MLTETKMTVFGYLKHSRPYNGLKVQFRRTGVMGIWEFYMLHIILLFSNVHGIYNVQVQL